MSDEVQQLARQLDDANPGVRASAAERLAQLGAEAQPAAVALVSAAGDDDEAVREWAVAALEGLEAPSLTDLKPLVALVEDANADRAFWAITLLSRLEDQAEAATPALARCLTRGDAPQVQQRAALALGKIGPGAGESLEVLRSTAASDDARLARLAKQAIEQIEP